MRGGAGDGGGGSDVRLVAARRVFGPSFTAPSDSAWCGRRSLIVRVRSRTRRHIFFFKHFFNYFKTKKPYLPEPNNTSRKSTPRGFAPEWGPRVSLARGRGRGLASGLPYCRLLSPSSPPPAGASARHRPGSATGRALLRPAALGVTARRAPPQRPAPAFCRFCARPGVDKAASRQPFTGTRMAESASAMTPDAASERNQLLLGSLPCTY